MQHRPERLFVLALVLLAPRGVFAREDLGRVYRATLDHEKRPIGHDWTTSEDDVWELKAFVFSFRDALRIELGASRVVFGRSGTNAVWAAVLPAEPGKIVAAPAGKGEAVTSVFLRFHPALVRQLFAPASVTGKGPAAALIPARRIYQYKIDASWQSNSMPVVPTKDAIVLDCETSEGKRRFFMVDTTKKSVKDEPAFLGRAIPKLAYGEFDEGSAVEVFDQVWHAFDREYAMFTVKPQVDWPALRDRYRPLAEAAQGRYEAAAVVAMLLAHLEDLHVSVKIEDELLWCYNRFRFLNANYNGVETVVGKFVDTQKGIKWCKTREGFGYVLVMGLGNEEVPPTFDRVLDELRDTRGLILDLRINGGGDELMARALAGRFLEKPAVYSSNQYRSGPKHDDLGPKLERTVEPRGPWRYDKPVAVLVGERTMSSAESFACMMAVAPNATLIGDRTAGSSANPRRLELPGKITVNLPRWLDMDHNGKPIDRVGVQPDVKIDVEPTKYGSSDDPVVRAALRHLQKR